MIRETKAEEMEESTTQVVRRERRQFLLMCAVAGSKPAERALEAEWEKMLQEDMEQRDAARPVPAGADGVPKTDGEVSWEVPVRMQCPACKAITAFHHTPSLGAVTMEANCEHCRMRLSVGVRVVGA